MLRNLKKMKGFKIQATDGDNLGKIKDIYFDDKKWVARYLVVDTGTWLTEKLLLISPYSVSGVGWEKQMVWINLSKKQIEHSPLADSEKTISRQYEEEYARYYGWPFYWSEPEGLWAGGLYPGAYAAGALTWSPPPASPLKEMSPEVKNRIESTHLRSFNECMGYKIHSRDDVFGHVEDLIFEEETWALRYLVIDTKNFWPSPHVLISPQWIESIQWEEREIFINLDKDIIKKAPHFDAKHPIERDFEDLLFIHYGFKPYWNGAYKMRNELPNTRP